MDKTSTRRICGVAAVSATALATFLGASPATAVPAAEPPGQVFKELRTTDPATYFFKQGFPVKWEGARPPADDSSRQVYQWWQKVE